MKIIEPSVEIIKEDNPLKKIELCGRVCYKSEDKITEDSAEKFVKMIIKRGHTSVLEHVQVGLVDWTNSIRHVIETKGYFENKLGQYSQPKRGFRVVNNLIICGNIRAWLEVLASDEIEAPVKSIIINSVLKSPYAPFFKEHAHFQNSTYGSEQCFEILDYLTVRLICDRGISHEIVRNRAISPSQESTRYCNYSGAITYVHPCFDWSAKIWKCWNDVMLSSEFNYNRMIELGATPQEARSVLPNSLKTEIILTATYAEWDGALALRLSKAAHPQMRQVMKMLVALPDFPAEIKYSLED